MSRGKKKKKVKHVFFFFYKQTAHIET